MAKTHKISTLILGFLIGCLLTIILGNIYLSNKLSEIRIEQSVILRHLKEKANTINYSSKKQENYEYSDEEIRIMREKQSYRPGYIKTRHVDTRKEEIENYIENHLEEIKEALNK